MLHQKDIFPLLRAIAPPLTHDLYKGQSGRICVIGGSEEYTGAPFYAAMSALKMGTDICHVICEKSASTVIKSYSPDLIVHPYLTAKESSFSTSECEAIVSKCLSVIDRVHVVVLGPGLSRDPMMQHTAGLLIEAFKKVNKPLILDADGLYAVQQSPELVKNYTGAILTPNAAEFQRLTDKLGLKGPSATAESLSKALGNVTIFQKGKVDHITDGTNTVVCVEEGSPRRCGGQGDVLTGTIAAFLAWANLFSS
ncbi:hypothetical protein HDU97_009590 [Phlyctochytrium planicorne]|nr:hypothetical protein HDU97_009590 [Phlyctochytrium planicorne]